MRTFTSVDAMEKEIENALRYPTKILNALSPRSPLQYHMLNLKKEFIFRLLCNLDPRNGQVYGTRYIRKYMTNNFLTLSIAP